MTPMGRIARVSERLAMRLKGSPEPALDGGYTMYPNWQLRLEIRDCAALEDAAQALMDDIRSCYPEGLDALDGLRPYIEALELALKCEQKPTEAP